MHRLDFEIDKPRLRRAWGKIDQVFSSHGLTLRRGYDFEEVDRLAALNGIKVLEAHFTPKLNTYTNGRAFWLGLIDSNGRLVGRVCARLDAMVPPMTLTEFWRKYFHRCYPTELGERVVLAPDQPRFAQYITGKTVYLGGTEVNADWRGKKLGGYLNRMAQIEALDEWDADYFYGWMEARTFKNGFLLDCGFARVHEQAVRWLRGGPAPIDDNLILAANSREDVLDMIDRMLDGPPRPVTSKKSAQNQPRIETSEPDGPA
ncbi:MAG: hypothetical protein JJ902_06510 [Roseibium sp.]|nr:hypothetical protein [Roseibium sp.]